MQDAQAIIADLKNKKLECVQKVWELLAFEAQSILAKYRADEKKLAAEIRVLADQIAAERAKAQALEKTNGELGRQVVTIATAVDGINTILRDSGFQGFELRVHEGSGQSAYRIVRPHNGKPAKDLSEGERNFIAFLYFYHLVRGSHSDNDIGKDKIVVIDDPVSSMDATVLHIVSMLVRDVADNCISPGEIKNVKQVFVLTHNAPFHIKTANYSVNQYDVASYFYVTKTDNISRVKLCVKPDPRRTGDFQNYNPMPSEYAGFWREYTSVQSILSLINVMWQILDFYFVQMREMDGDNLIDTLLVANKERFVERLPNGTEDKSKLIMVTKLMSYMGSRGHAQSEQQVAELDNDADKLRNTFEMIFTAMEQDQHYRMMMAETEK